MKEEEVITSWREKVEKGQRSGNREKYVLRRKEELSTIKFFNQRPRDRRRHAACKLTAKFQFDRPAWDIRFDEFVLEKL